MSKTVINDIDFSRYNMKAKVKYKHKTAKGLTPETVE